MAFSVQKSAVAGARANAVAGSVSRRSIVTRNPVAVSAQRGEGNVASGVVAGLAAAMLLGQPAMADIMPMYQTAFVPSDSMLEDFSRKSGSTDPFQQGTDLSALPGEALQQAQKEVKQAGSQTDQVPDISTRGGAANLPGPPKLNPVKNPEAKAKFQEFCDDVKSTVCSPIDAVKSAVGKGTSNVKNAVSDSAGSIKSAVNEGASNAKSSANDLKVKGSVNDAAGNISSVVKSTVDSAGSNFKKAGDDLKKPFDEARGNIGTTVGGGSESSTKASFNNTFGDLKQAGDKLKGAASEQADNIKSAVSNDPISNIKQAGNDLKGAAREQGDNLKAAVSNDPISNIKSAFNDAKANLTN